MGTGDERKKRKYKVMEDLPSWYEINIIFVTHYPDPKRWYKNQQCIEVTTPSSARFMRQRGKRRSELLYHQRYQIFINVVETR